MIKGQIKALLDFHEKGKLHISEHPNLPYQLERELRRRLLKEEFREYLDAEEADDLVGIARELADMVYVICGTAVSYGIDLDAVLCEVTRANADKVSDPEKIVWDENGKVKKPDGWKPPNVLAALQLRNGRES